MLRNLCIEQVTNELQEVRRQLAARLALRDDAYVEQEADQMDQIQAAEAREFALRHLDRHARQLRQVEEALQRLGSGEYGICPDCEEEIGAKRLRAVPWAERCRSCQEAFDQRTPGGEEGDVQFRMNAA